MDDVILKEFSGDLFTFEGSGYVLERNFLMMKNRPIGDLSMEKFLRLKNL